MHCLQPAGRNTSPFSITVAKAKLRKLLWNDSFMCSLNHCNTPALSIPCIAYYPILFDTIIRSSSTVSTYDVFTAEYKGDPNHVAIYIETHPAADGEELHPKGRLYHILGNILHGMKYEKRDSDTSLISHRKYAQNTLKKIGTIAVEDIDQFKKECCKGVPPPGSQISDDGNPKDSSKPEYRCKDWADDMVKLALDKGILKG
ncbi:uncharacterized protein BDV17DRAFT_286542 [Aspergillus undulatus]|uniref:uncharacterized protein n=1 Tax=Aspergillus undulatus TaxID=1810928 RepID=UPI003CCD17DA